MTKEKRKHRVTCLTAENIKRLKAVRLTLKDPVTVVAGSNGEGKTSLLDAVLLLLLGKRHPDPELLRRGEEKGFVEAETETLRIRRTITAGGGGSLTIRALDNRAEYRGPQSLLDEATKHCMDPVAFLRLDPKQQAKRLKDLVGLDFSEIDAEMAKVFEHRTENNRLIKAAQSVVEEWEYDAAATEMRSDEELRKKLEGITAARGEADTARSVLRAKEDTLRKWDASLQELRDEKERILARLANLEKSIPDLEGQVGNAQRAVKKAATELEERMKSIPDGTELLNEIEAIRAHNENVRNTQRRAERVAELERYRESSAKMTATLDALAAKKEKILADSKMPIKGLSFNESGVVLNDLPFSQASSAEQLRTAVAIAAAMQPEMRLMVVKDGSLLDDKSMALLCNLADEFDLQVLVERVERDQWATVLIEDGTIVEPPDANQRPDSQGTLTLES